MSSAPAQLNDTALAPRRSPWPGLAWLLLLAAGFRVWFISARQLVPDEAFYWVLSRHISCGYLDHPPMVAYLIRLSTWLFGSTELGVRLPLVPLMFGALLVLVSLGRQLGMDRFAVLLLVVLWLCNPLFAGLSSIITPETPAVFFSVCAIGCAVAIARRWDVAAPAATAAPRTLPLWLAFGLLCGLGMLSKYTVVLVPGAVFLALLFAPTGRRELRRPGIWLAGIVAAIVFSPVVYWNATHHWASFGYQLRHGLRGASPEDVQHWRDALEYVGGQFGVFSPLLLVIGVVVAVLNWRRYAALPLQHRVLLWTATVPLAFFGLASTRTHGEANWPAVAYFPLSLLMVLHFVSDPAERKQRLGWAIGGCAVALLISLFLQAPELLFRSHLLREPPRKLLEIYGWREMGEKLGRSAQGAMVICFTHQDAAEATFYTPGQPDAWAVSINARPTAYEFFDGPSPLDSAQRVLLVGGRADEFCNRYGFRSTWQGDWSIVLFGHKRDRQLNLCERAKP